MKIVLVLSQFLPDSNGGVENLAVRFYRSFTKEGHQVFLVAGRITHEIGLHGKVNKENQDDIQVFRILVDQELQHTKPQWIIFDEQLFQSLSDIYNQIKPDIIHILQMGALTFSPLLAAQELRIPTIFSAVNYEILCQRTTLLKSDGSICNGPSSFHKCLNCNRHHSWKANFVALMTSHLNAKQWRHLSQICKKILPRSIGILELGEIFIYRSELVEQQIRLSLSIMTASNWVKELLIQYGFQQDNIRVISRGIRQPISLQKDLSENYKQKTNAIRFGYLGRIHPTKGIEILLQAYKKVRIPQKTRLEIFGKPDPFELTYFEQLKNIASEVDDIHFNGEYQLEQIDSIFENVDIVIIPSIWYETFGIVVLEAAFHGKPVIASDLGGLAENVRMHQAGWLFPAGDVDALADIMRRCRDEAGFVMEQAGQIHRPKTIEEEVEEVLDGYQACINGHYAIFPEVMDA